MRSRLSAFAWARAAVLAGAPIFAGLAAHAGCAHPAPAPPEVVRFFATAVAGGQWERAYGLMSDDYRRRVSLAKFRAEIQSDRQIIDADAIALSKEASGGPVRAIVETRGGERIALVLDGGAWRLEDQPLSPFGQQSPRAALRTLVRAVERRRYDIVLRLVPARHRPSVTEQALRAYWEGGASDAQKRLLQALRAHLDAPIVDLGREAYMPFGSLGPSGDAASSGSEGEVRFVLEDGVWKIEDAR